MALETFIANLKGAIRNRETVTIDGGEFNTEELQEVLTALREYEKILKANYPTLFKGK